MAVVPVLLARAEVGHPAIGQLLGRVVEPLVLAVGQRVVVDGRLDEVAGHVALVIAAVAGRPALGPALAVGQGVGGLQIAVRLLGGQDLRNPVLQGGLHLLLGLDDLRVALRIDHQRDAHGLDGLMHPGVGEHVALVPAVRLAAQSFLAASMKLSMPPWPCVRFGSLIWSMQWGIQFTIRALARAFHSGLSIL